jgi:hypothetical protein
MAARAPELHLRARRDVAALVALHGAYGVAGAVALSLDPPAKGWGVFACVVAYNVALPLTARALGRRDWLALWAFLLAVSVFQVAPDWFLAGRLGTLVFPDIGGPRLGGEIQLAMAGMWVAPLFGALALAKGSAARAAGLALLIFLGSELAAPVLDLWEPRAATEVAGVALYVLPPEAALGWAAMVAFTHVRGRTPSLQAGAAAAVATFYTGALALSHFLLETADWSLAL